MVEPSVLEGIMADKYCIASHGLLIGWPIDELAQWLNSNTPRGIHFNVVGGYDPQPQQEQIYQPCLEAAQAGKDLILVGHSKGAMLIYYLADQLKAAGQRVKLACSIDPTDWGSNAPGTIPWSVCMDGNAGNWLVPNNAETWLNFYQDQYPGGGIGHLAPGNTNTAFRQSHQPGESHLSIPNSAITRKAILAAVLATIQEPQS
jgi:hypothetical protein